MAAFVATLAILVYLSLSSVIKKDVRPRAPDATSEQASDGRMPTTPLPGGKTPGGPEDIVARKPPTLSGNDAAKSPVGGYQAAASPKSGIDRPVAVTQKRDPWEKMPVEKIEPANLEEDKMTSGIPEPSKAADPAIVPAAQSNKIKIQRFHIFFKPGSAELENTSFDVLSRVSQLLSSHPGSRITLTSFSDSKGGKVYHSKLSALRTNGVKSFFASRGFGARLTVSENLPAPLPKGIRPPAKATSESWAEIRFETRGER